MKHYIRAAMNNTREDLFLKDPGWEIMEGQAEGPKTKHWLGGNPIREVILKYFSLILID